MPANPGGVVYGTILVATLLAAERSRGETYPRTVGAVAVALALYWLANAYARYTGERARERDHFTAHGYLAALVHELTVLYGALGPLVAVLACWAAGATLPIAVSVAVWSAVAIIIASELAIGIRSELEGRELAIQTAFGALLGALVVALRVLLH